MQNGSEGSVRSEVFVLASLQANLLALATSPHMS